jgi:clan AA aspartic protease
MEGEVNPFLELITPIQLVTESGGIVDLDAVIDTGFSEYLLLPNSIINACGFYYFDAMHFTLANGDEVLISVHVGSIRWFGQTCKVYVLNAETEPLIGMKQLKGCRVSFEVIDGGPVTIGKI